MASQQDPFARPEILHAITLTGAMNPAIHHPAWYRMIGLISAEELEVALKKQAVPAAPGSAVSLEANMAFVSPQFSQFTVGGLRVTCVAESWTIATVQADLLERITDIASKAFAHLAHTPMSAFTVAFSHHIETHMRDVGEDLAALLRGLPLGLGHSDAAQQLAQFRYIARFPERELAVDVQPSVQAKSKIFVAVTSAHRFEAVSGEELKLVDIGPMLQAAVRSDRAEADRVVTRITEAMSQRGRAD